MISCLGLELVYLSELDGTNSAALGFRVNFVLFEPGLELAINEGI